MSSCHEGLHLFPKYPTCGTGIRAEHLMTYTVESAMMILFFHSVVIMMYA